MKTKESKRHSVYRRFCDTTIDEQTITKEIIPLVITFLTERRLKLSSEKS